MAIFHSILLTSSLSFLSKLENSSFFSQFISPLALIAKVNEAHREGEKKKSKECCPPDWSSFLSLAEILRVHLSCHLYCNCPLFCHSDYTQQGHANEELKIGCLKVRSTEHQSLSRYVVQFPLQKLHQKLNGNEAWLDKKKNKEKKGGESLRAHCGKHETKACGRYLPGSVGEC